MNVRSQLAVTFAGLVILALLLTRYLTETRVGAPPPAGAPPSAGAPLPSAGEPLPAATPPAYVPRVAGRSILVGDEEEEIGYGLYSYLLFGSPPNDATRDRYLKAIEAYLGLLQEIDRLEKSFKRSELNITYLPLDTQITESPSPQVVLDHYNYVRALVLLRALPGIHKDGPYIVSLLQPFSGVSQVSSEFLFQDLSSVPPDLSWSWVKEFLAQSSQEHFWEKRRLPQFALRLRGHIETLSKAYPDVQKSVKDWIKWQD